MNDTEKIFYAHSLLWACSGQTSSSAQFSGKEVQQLHGQI